MKFVNRKQINDLVPGDIVVYGPKDRKKFESGCACYVLMINTIVERNGNNYYEILTISPHLSNTTIEWNQFVFDHVISTYNAYVYKIQNDV